MQFEGTTYRPPVEADSMLLQVTVGCAHNRCSYCNMYRDVQFRIVDMDRIERDLLEARRIYPRAERIFLVNGDAFVLNAPRLLEIAEKIHQYFPECSTITMYGSIRNIKDKSDEELRALKNGGINDLYVGLESGWDAVVRRINKGYTVKEANTQLQRLNGAGINHIALLMLGVAGSGNGIENARLTAEFLNLTQPKLVWAGTLAVFEGTELSDEIQHGIFNHPTELEILLEEQELIRRIELNAVPFYGVHPTNAVPVRGLLPRDRERMISAIDNAIHEYGEEALATVFQRNSL